MTDNPIIIALPVGEFDSPLIRSEFEAIVSAFQRLGADLVIADPVSDAAGAQASVHRLSEKNPDLLLIVPLRGLSAPAIEAASQASQAPCLIWPVQGRFALPSSTLAIGALREGGAPVELLYVPPDHPTSINRSGCIARAAMAFTRIRQGRIGVIGGLFPNLVACRYDPQTVTSRLGAAIVPVAYEEVRVAMQSISNREPELERAQQVIASSYAVDAEDTNALRAGIKLHLALKLVAHEQRLDGFAAECWTGLPGELGLNPCLGFIEDAYTLACEGDVLLCLGLLIARYLTGKRAYVGDLYDLDLEENLTLIHCGAPASLASSKNEVVLAKSQAALERGFETLTCRPRLDTGRVTLFRYYGENCDQMHLVLGELRSSEQSPNLTVKLKIDGDRWDFLEKCFGNHYIVVAGDIRAELKLLGKWFGITILE